jgi:UDP-N-acetylenolpyruvoylglucosamine reductase
MDRSEVKVFLDEAVRTYKDDPSGLVHEIWSKWSKDTKEVYEDGYDKAASDITLKIQNCIPSASRTIEEARLKGAWTDAAKIALNHVGKLSNANYPE